MVGPSSEDGAAIVEMAIVLPVLLLILFGIIDMGRLLQQHIQLTAAAREGARLGALNGTVAEVKTKITSVVGTGVTLTYPTTNGVTVCAASSPAGTDSVVNVQRVFQPATPLMAWIARTTPVTITAKGVMSCLG
ncbi:pilus assembly protein [Actinoplanes sichuanensis]|uniref:TadE/TadG family type IV pilus assembly protein n=1 Tax=Actinoplanes sichuanensis TaxID=512349 RepID=A0ABW4AB21_9ACTN|nr:TadE family protein [Actinoplanes sichuanensis]BEL08723.1 pilus assembly protein [Actinoplanes sichuanensis]